MTTPAPASVRIQRRIEWPDTDAAGHYHHLTVFRLVETAEAVLHERLGIVHQTFGRTPRVHIEADFRKRLYFTDLVDLTLSVVDIRRSSLRYRFELQRAGELAAAGEVVAVLLDEDRKRAVSWPDAWRKLLLESGPQRPQLLAGP